MQGWFFSKKSYKKILVIGLGLFILLTMPFYEELAAAIEEDITAIPVVTSISFDTIGDLHNTSYPLLIFGENLFSNNITVKFISTGRYKNTYYARRITVVENEGSLAEDYLKVYLPRLGVGVYNIEIINTDQGYREILPLAFKVLKSQEYDVTEHGSYILKKTLQGTVFASVDINECTLELDPNYYSSYWFLELDDLMGEETRSRRIVYDAYDYIKINELHTYSRWADISIFGIQAVNKTIDSEIEILLGRLPESVAISLRRQLQGRNICSEFIEVGGNNYNSSRVSLSFPYKQSQMDKLQALHYNQYTRRWQEIPFTADWINRRVKISYYSPGIFVLVERRN